MGFDVVVRYRWWIRLSLLLYGVIVLFAANHFTFFLLNLPLAYIPLELTIFLYRRTYIREHVVFFIPIALLWLLFYPNAPYLITDFFHLRVLPFVISVYNTQEGHLSKAFSTDVSVWAHFALMTISVLVGLTAGFISLGMMIKMLRDKWPKISLFAWLSAITLLASYAIYIGRFLRLHSIDLVLFPVESAQRLLAVWFEPNFWPFLLFMTMIQAVMLIIWYPWIAGRR